MTTLSSLSSICIESLTSLRSSLLLLQPVVAVRFCPLLFEVEEGAREGTDGPFDLPYKMVLAVATMDSVMLYDTTRQAPFAVLGSLHPDRAPITDIAWSCDARYLATSSIDGAAAQLQCAVLLLCSEVHICCPASPALHALHGIVEHPASYAVEFACSTEAPEALSVSAF